MSRKVSQKGQTMRLLAALLAVAALATSLPAIAKTDRAAAGEARLAKALEGRTAGEPVRCISLRSIRSTTIIDRTAILYDVGGKLYLNRPTGGASTLHRDDVLLTRTSGSQLCDLDTVHLIDRGSHVLTGFVHLGRFVPYAKAPGAANAG
jgi:hypothetical protein